MTEAEANGYYRAEYRRTYQGDEAPVKRDLAVQTARARSLVDYIRPNVQSIQRCLDIGSSAGLLLQAVREVYHSDVVGVEPGNAYRNLASGKGLKVFPSLEKVEKAGGRFDLVCMSHVLEHLPSPAEYLAHLRNDLLASDGWLLIEVPNLYAHESFEPAHLQAFSPHTLRETLKQGGFQVIRFKKHGQPNSAILPLYLTALCRAEPGRRPIGVKRETGVTMKRRAGLLERRVVQRLFPNLAWKKTE
jgi:2-polyprenyl-3-methyl-5-hydroxy-6-metoxy-1,4-benzoquinol methylase